MTQRCEAALIRVLCRFPHDALGRLASVFLFEKTQCSPFNDVDDIGLPDGDKFGGAIIGINLRHDENALMFRCEDERAHSRNLTYCHERVSHSRGQWTRPARWAALISFAVRYRMPTLLKRRHAGCAGGDCCAAEANHSIRKRAEVARTRLVRRQRRRDECVG